MSESVTVILLILVFALGLATLTALNLWRDLMAERAETQRWRDAARYYEKRYDDVKSKEEDE